MSTRVKFRKENDAIIAGPFVGDGMLIEVQAVGTNSFTIRTSNGTTPHKDTSVISAHTRAKALKLLKKFLKEKGVSFLVEVRSTLGGSYAAPHKVGMVLGDVV